MFPWFLSYITPKTILYTVIGTIIIGILVLLKYQSVTINNLRDAKAKLEVAVQEQERTIIELKKDYTQIISAKDQINKKAKELEKKNQALEDSLYRERQGKESLEDLILKDKKGRIEKIINEATIKVFRCLEILTGSPLKKGEVIECK